MYLQLKTASNKMKAHLWIQKNIIFKFKNLGKSYLDLNWTLETDLLIKMEIP